MIALLQSRCRSGDDHRPRNLDLRGINLNHQDLTGLDLSGYDLREAAFNRADLSKTNFSYARLDMATLDHALLDECEFIGANLSGAGLDECTARMCGFGGANLTGASLISADLSDSVFSKSILARTDFRAAVLKGARLSESDLTGAVFTRADLSRADLKQADVAGASFEKANMQGCRLEAVRHYKRAGWIGADIRDMDLRGAYRIRRFISDENYLWEFKCQNRWTHAIYVIWWLTSDCGRSLSRWFLWLLVATLLFAGIYSWIGVDYGDYPTWYSSIYFSFTTLTTVGFGDAVPSTLAGQLVVTLQAVTGYMGLGGLLSILGNKMARRAE